MKSFATVYLLHIMQRNKFDLVLLSKSFKAGHVQHHFFLKLKKINLSSTVYFF